MPPPRARGLLAAKILLAAAVAFFAGRALVRQWEQVREAAAGIEPNWLLILASSAIVLATFAMLADAWRRLVAAWGRPMPFRSAVRIWAVSSLGRYVPGKVWQMGTMAVMAQQQGISGVAAAGSALLITVVSTLVGFGVVAVFGLPLLRFETLGIAVLVALAVAVLLAPRIMPWAAAFAARATGRELGIPALSHGMLWHAIIATAISWIAYGFAFWLLAHAVLDDPTGGLPAYIAIYTFSYLLGFLALFAPGGIVVREVALAAALVNLGMPEGSAIVLAIVSRLWLTVLEISPALIFLAADQLRRRSRDAAQESTH